MQSQEPCWKIHAQNPESFRSEYDKIDKFKKVHSIIILSQHVPSNEQNAVSTILPQKNLFEVRKFFI